MANGGVFAVRVAHLNRSAALALTGELDLATVGSLRTTADDVVSTHLKAVTVDLTGLSFCDVSGLRELDHLRRAALRVGATFALTGVRAYTRLLMSLARFDELAAAERPAPASEATFASESDGAGKRSGVDEGARPAREIIRGSKTS